VTKKNKNFRLLSEDVNYNYNYKHIVVLSDMLVKPCFTSDMT